MIEVFKTNVCSQQVANKLTREIHQSFLQYQANFDLQDCDRILRIKCSSGIILPALIIDFLKDFGYDAEVLPDKISFTGQHLTNNLLPSGSF